MVRWRRDRDSRQDLTAAIGQGVALRDEFDATGNAASLDRSVQVLQAAAAAARGDPSVLSAALGSLGLSLRDRARITTGRAGSAGTSTRPWPCTKRPTGSSRATASTGREPRETWRAPCGSAGR